MYMSSRMSCNFQKKFKQNEYEEPDEFATDMRKIFTFIYRFSKNSPSLVKETQDIQVLIHLIYSHVLILNL